MKNLKLFGLIAVASLLMTACSKDDDTPASSGSVSYNSKTYQFSYAYHANMGVDGSYIEFMPASLETILASTNGKFTVLSIDFADSTLNAGTFTYKSKYDATFDKTVNFTGATLYIDANVNTSSNVSVDIASGTVKVAKSGSNYTISYDCITEDDKTLKGSYTGTVAAY